MAHEDIGDAATTLPFPSWRRATPDGRAWSYKLTAGLLVALWLRSLTTSATRILTVGRTATESTPLPTPASAISQASTVLVAAVLITALAHRVWLAATSRSTVERETAHTVGLSSLLGLWSVTLIATLYQGDRPDPILAFSAVCIVVIASSCAAPQSLWRVWALTAVGSSALSLTLMLIDPAAALQTPTASDDKSILPTGQLLAGPYLQSNILGTTLALGVAFVPALRHRLARAISYTLLLTAIGLTASRTAWIATAAVVLTQLLITSGRSRYWTGAAAAAAITPVIALPIFASGDPQSFTGRGQIWAGVIADAVDHFALGGGVNYFVDALAGGARLGTAAFHGHNLAINTLATAGALGLLLLTVVVVCCTSLAQGWSPASSIPAGALVSLLTVGWLEPSIEVTDLNNWVGWAATATLLISSSAAPRRTTLQIDDVASPGPKGV